MELPELEERLPAFCRARYATADIEVVEVVKMHGLAGFAYGFRVQVEGRVDGWFLRLPPPNVNWVGTADVLRQVAALNAMDGADVPHCSVQWSGDDLKWFGRPYFVVPWLAGDVLRIADGEWGGKLNQAQRLDLGMQAMSALAGIHKVDPAAASYLGDPVAFGDDVKRWDRFYERVAEPQRLELVPTVRQKLLDSAPQDAPVGIFHGDFQVGNLFCSPEEVKLLAVIDWELCGIGAVHNDLGWAVTFSDPAAWTLRDGEGPGGRDMFLDPGTLIELYSDAYGERPGCMNWFRALAAYKFSIIAGFNLSLHRRGKREDPLWEEIGLSMGPLIARADELVSG
ncbi:MAG: phosphotransferase family protein [Pseudomonadales bacterium]|jgi:aminoglycoside phosphotransferase (APT) family kinase protein|nr:phosphotransferase family protein [Pseudomonadales bacterium]MDP6472459.1 phosphotransferase family protein [Pseudomonadales bacterium]MDP6828730.1 phosphotransferase family protein [Pseudomonadales bacterium]MDP6971473.1 phosphotransferase family protein [Pseudomonadales bacterium]|tara:strand:- start:1321 stop:2340 length:1020 start_codon:yes stop_codon:yes gene_type:complete